MDRLISLELMMHIKQLHNLTIISRDLSGENALFLYYAQRMSDHAIGMWS